MNEVFSFDIIILEKKIITFMWLCLLIFFSDIWFICHKYISIFKLFETVCLLCKYNGRVQLYKHKTVDALFKIEASVAHNLVDFSSSECYPKVKTTETLIVWPPEGLMQDPATDYTGLFTNGLLILGDYIPPLFF